MRYRGFLWIAALPVLLAGCRLVNGDDPEDDLQDRRQAWLALGIRDYTYDFVRSCFCGGPAGRALRIVVRANQIVSVTDVQTGGPPQFTPPAWAVTIDDLFVELQREINRGVDKIDFTFDATFHFPTRVSIDRIKNAIDDEQEMTLSNFVSLR